MIASDNKDYTQTSTSQPILYGDTDHLGRQAFILLCHESAEVIDVEDQQF